MLCHGIFMAVSLWQPGLVLVVAPVTREHGIAARLHDSLYPQGVVKALDVDVAMGRIVGERCHTVHGEDEGAGAPACRPMTCLFRPGAMQMNQGFECVGAQRWLNLLWGGMDMHGWCMHGVMPWMIHAWQGMAMLYMV